MSQKLLQMGLPLLDKITRIIIVFNCTVIYLGIFNMSILLYQNFSEKKI